MKYHELKILPEHFKPVWNGTKKAELRKDDRCFNVGDVLCLNEWDGEKYTGNFIEVEVTHILRNCSDYGLSDGYCILSISTLGAAKWGGD